MARFAQPDGRPVMVHNFAREHLAPETDLAITASEPIPIGQGHRTPALRRFNGRYVGMQWISQ